MSPRNKKKRRQKNALSKNRKHTSVEREQQSLKASGQLSSVASLDPLAPIIVGSGRPFAHAVAEPTRFPPPSTLAGCLRTAWARATGMPFGPDLAQLWVAGPLLLNRDNQVLVPKPSDALYFGHGDMARCVRTEPRPFDVGGADLPDGLLPVQLTESAKGKPGTGPAWWSWNDLITFRNGGSVSHAQLCQNGWTPPPGDRRTHVAIGPGGAAEAGKLFQTEGLDFDAPDSAHGGLRLLVRCEKALNETLVHLGGERRLAALQPEPEAIWPDPPKDWLDNICDSGGLCLTLLTPGIFSNGYHPGWLHANLTGSPPNALKLKLQLRAAAVDRWQPHSGWDLANQQPRPTRKLVGAGATYWFRIVDGAADLDALKALWLTSVSDDDQDRRDGFGLTLPSLWKPV